MKSSHRRVSNKTKQIKKKRKKNLDKNGEKNKPKNYRRITNLKTRCADQSDLVPFISHFRWSQTLDIFLFFFFFPFFLLSSSFLSLVRGAATPGNLFYKAVECLTRDNEVNQRLAFKKELAFNVLCKLATRDSTASDSMSEPRYIRVSSATRQLCLSVLSYVFIYLFFVYRLLIVATRSHWYNFCTDYYLHSCNDFFLFIYDAYKNLVMIIYLNRALYTEYFFFFKHYLREPSMKFCVTAHFFQS